MAALLTLSLTLITSAARAHAVKAAADFSGHWIQVSATPVRQGYEQFWLGTEVIVTQGPDSLGLTRIAPLPQRKATFRLDRSESENEYSINGQRIVRSSRASWNGNALLISTDTTMPDGQRWLSNILRWSLDPDGMLVVGDTEICGHGECPSVITTLRFRKATEL